MKKMMRMDAEGISSERRAYNLINKSDARMRQRIRNDCDNVTAKVRKYKRKNPSKIS